MKIYDITSAALCGEYEGFMEHYKPENINTTNRFSGANALCLSFAKADRLEERIRIASFLIEEGININFVDIKTKRNALHWMFNGFKRVDPNIYFSMAKKMVDKQIDVNAKDIYGAIPLSYAIANNKLSTEEMRPVYLYLLAVGSDYEEKNRNGQTCLDLAKLLPFRSGFIQIVEEFVNGN